MSAPSRTKENLRLLDLSSTDELESDDLHLEIIQSKKKKVSRRDRSRGTSAVRPQTEVGASEIRCAMRWTVRIGVLFWLVTLTYLSITLYEQISTLNIQINKVSTSSESVGDALQLCHTAAKELRANATNLSSRLDKLERVHVDLAKRVDQALSELASVSEQLSASPKLVDTPKRLAELQRTVAEFGSQINGFDGALQSTRKQAVAATTGLDEMRTYVHEVEARTNETAASASSNLQRGEELRRELGAVNATLAARLDALQAKLEDSTKTSSPAAPTTTTTSTATPSLNTTPITTTTTIQGPPAKPNITQ